MLWGGCTPCTQTPCLQLGQADHAPEEQPGTIFKSPNQVKNPPPLAPPLFLSNLSGTSLTLLFLPASSLLMLMGTGRGDSCVAATVWKLLSCSSQVNGEQLCGEPGKDSSDGVVAGWLFLPVPVLMLVGYTWENWTEIISLHSYSPQPWME